MRLPTRSSGADSTSSALSAEGRAPGAFTDTGAGQRVQALAASGAAAARRRRRSLTAHAVQLSRHLCTQATARTTARETCPQGQPTRGAQVRPWQGRPPLLVPAASCQQLPDRLHASTHPALLHRLRRARPGGHFLWQVASGVRPGELPCFIEKILIRACEALEHLEGKAAAQPHRLGGVAEKWLTHALLFPIQWQRPTAVSLHTLVVPR